MLNPLDMPLMTKRLLQILAATVVLALVFVLLGMWSILPRTKYAEGFSTAGFQAIQPGDTEAEVIRRLGLPIESYSEESAEQWCFEAPPTEPEFFLGPLLGLSSPDECLFIEKGVVVSVRSNGNSPRMRLQGQTVAEAERRLGRPKYVLPPGTRSVLRYAKQRDDSDNYEAHEVILDGERVVRRTAHYLYLD